jgi:hypothetical protein
MSTYLLQIGKVWLIALARGSGLHQTPIGWIKKPASKRWPNWPRWQDLAIRTTVNCGPRVVKFPWALRFDEWQHRG